MDKLIIIGGPGNGTIAASIVEDVNQVKPTWEIIGFLNDFDKGPINGYPVIGKVIRVDVEKYLEDNNVYFLYTLISIKMNFNHIHKLHDLRIPVERFANIIHPTAVISRNASIGFGVMVAPFVTIGPDVEIFNHVQIFASSLIGHNSTLENYSYVANHGCIGAHVHAKEGAYIGTNACTIENITICEWAVVGMGAVVIRDVKYKTKVAGNPAKEIGRVT